MQARKEAEKEKAKAEKEAQKEQQRLAKEVEKERLRCDLTKICEVFHTALRPRSLRWQVPKNCWAGAYINVETWVPVHFLACCTCVVMHVPQQMQLCLGKCCYIDTVHYTEVLASRLGAQCMPAAAPSDCLDAGRKRRQKRRKPSRKRRQHKRRRR